MPDKEREEAAAEGETAAGNAEEDGELTGTTDSITASADEPETNTPEADEDTDGAGAAGKKKSEEKLELYDWVQCIVVALVAGIMFFIFCARIVKVEGHSMVPTLQDGDKIVTTKLFYTPKAGDIVVVQTNTFGPKPIVKRIIATGGQTVNIDFDEGIVYVDGVALDEPYTNDLTYKREDFTGEVTVPEGCLFLMGDNRNNSTDSRSNDIGMVDERCIIGKVCFVAIPMSEDGRSLEWSRIGGV